MANKNLKGRRPPVKGRSDLHRKLRSGIDLQQILDEFENALAILETASNSLRGSPITTGHLRSEVLALSQGLKALRAVGRTLNLAIARVMP